MYKNIIRTAFLFATGIFMTACSSGDDELADNNNSGTPSTKDIEVTLTGTISTGSDITRAVADDGKTVSWNVGDEICVQYIDKDENFSTVKGKITSIDSDTHKAKFTATLTNLAPNLTTTNIGLAYPYSNVTAGGSTVTNFSMKSGLLSTQAGTIAGINDAKLDIAWTEDAVAINISNATATLEQDAVLKNQVCIAKFTLREGTSGTTPFNTTSLTVTDASSNSYAVTTTTKTNEFFVVLPAISGSITIKATGQQKYTGTPEEINSSRTTYTYGEYIVVNPTTRQAYTAAVSDISNDTEYSKTYANSILKAGKFYDQIINIGQEYIPVAVIAHVGEVTNYWSKFLALGLSDVTTSPIEATSTVSSETTAAITAWMNNNNMTIDGTPYNSLYAVHYDEVPESPQVGGTNHYASSFLDSKTRSTTGVKGWRVPSVTDFRYIIQSVTSSRVSATDPKGVMDFNGIYELDSTNPHVLTQSGYGRNETLAKNINTLCHNSEFDTHYYWTSSKLTTNTAKGWRFDFDNNHFVWSQASAGASDMAKVRPVFAY